ncbi:MAG: HAD-IA family hydrolase [Hyphomicrobiales bacterium]
MTEPRLIIFDFDGTLADSQDTIATAMDEAFRYLGHIPPEREKTLSIVGLSLIEAMQVLVPDAESEFHKNLAEEYKAAFYREVSSPGHVEPLYDGARDAILKLSAEPHTLLGIATGKSQRGVRRVLDAHGLVEHFITIQTADDAPSKPHPAMIHQAIAATGIEAGNTLMIGDTSYDIEMAHRAEVYSAAVSWGYHPEEHLCALEPHIFARDFEQLLADIDGLIHGAPEKTIG